MEQIKQTVDRVIHAFESRRRKRWVATRQSLTATDPELRRWHDTVETILRLFPTATVDRRSLLRQVRRRFEGREWTVDFAGVADEFQRMARDDLWRHLTDKGVPDAPARRIAQGYSVGALLHES